MNQPEELLFLHYATLATTTQERLQLLATISALFNRPPGLYDGTALGLSPGAWPQLCVWLQHNPSPFWTLEQQSIRIHRACQKHVIIGTGQLIEDLRFSSPSRPSFDDVWQAASLFIQQNIEGISHDQKAEA
uniref:Uncharacterized protein n=1 Tax=Thermosporothrix sp. COM3 TaxID=2490863 RepID=A0A455SGC2_9CHLR|nr:hypothetical protein KTC_13010 [Thermosporothrix sp. COM3]